MYRFTPTVKPHIFNIIEDGKNIGLLLFDGDGGGNVGFSALIDGKVGYYARDLMKVIESSKAPDADIADDATLKMFSLEVGPVRLQIGTRIEVIDSITAVKSVHTIRMIQRGWSGTEADLRFIIETLEAR